jgi:hypothetical protein
MLGTGCFSVISVISQFQTINSSKSIFQIIAIYNVSGTGTVMYDGKFMYNE